MVRYSNNGSKYGWGWRTKCVAEKLNEYGMITSLTKQHDVKKIKQNKNIKKIFPNIALSVGIKLSLIHI